LGIFRDRAVAVDLLDDDGIGFSGGQGGMKRCPKSQHDRECKENQQQSFFHSEASSLVKST